MEIIDGHHPLFWVGLALIITSVFVAFGLCCAADGLEVFCTPFLSITFLISGIFCMVSTAKWCLVIIIINLLSTMIHVCRSCQMVRDVDHCTSCEEIKFGVLRWIIMVPYVLGIGLSIAAMCLAANELSCWVFSTC